MRRITNILLLLALATSIFASTSEPVVIKGIVKDKQTKELIPFAHVIVNDKVTISNIHGEFAISIEDPTDEITLKVSYLGYETHKEKIKSFDKYYEVFITPSTTQLEEVTVQSGSEIMKRVFRNFHLNYIMEPLHMVSYYQESLRDTADYRYLVEGILDIYTPSNVNKYGSPLVSSKRSRKKIFTAVPEEDMLAGNASDMAHSSIWRFDSFLSKKNRKNYEYFYDGTAQIGDHEILMVEFEPKNKRGTTSGTLYIDNITYSILKLEYHPNTERSKFWEEVVWTEEYELIDGSFQMVSVTYEGSGSNNTLHYQASLIVNDATVSYDVPFDEKLIGINDIFVEEAEYGTISSFWDGFHMIKLNNRVAELTRETNQDY